MPSSCGGTVRPTVCVAVSDYSSLSTYICLDLKGHLAPFLGWLAGPETTEGQDGRFRGEEGRVPILPHPAPPGTQANGKNVHTQGRRMAAPSGTALCTENKFFWYQLKFGRKWLLGGRKLDSAHINPSEGQESSYLGLNRVTEKPGPHTLYPIELRAQPTPPGHLG